MLENMLHTSILNSQGGKKQDYSTCHVFFMFPAIHGKKQCIYTTHIFTLYLWDPKFNILQSNNVKQCILLTLCNILNIV